MCGYAHQHQKEYKGRNSSLILTLLAYCDVMGEGSYCQVQMTPRFRKI